jgi:predicted DNA binding CopG/RHH family protein
MTKKISKTKTKKKLLSRAKPKANYKAASGYDAQLEEFQTRDLGTSMRASGAGQMINRKTKPTSLLLEPDLINDLRIKGAKRGLGYQTMLKMIVRENLSRY